MQGTLNIRFTHAQTRVRTWARTNIIENDVIHIYPCLTLTIRHPEHANHAIHERTGSIFRKKPEMY